MQIMPHGGWCCGVNHLRGFGRPTDPAYQYTQVVLRGKRHVYDSVAGRYTGTEDDPSKDHIDWSSKEREGVTREAAFDEAVTTFTAGLLEVVLTDKCLSHPSHGKFWANKLKAAGFKLVSRFTNPKSGNVCNVFHLYKKPPVEGNPPNWE